MITKETAIDIALAYREIETAEKLLAEVAEAHDRRDEPDIRDAFGRLQTGLQLAVPSGKSSHSLFHVAWSLAKPVIEAHIAQQKSKVAALNEKAKIESFCEGAETLSSKLRPDPYVATDVQIKHMADRFLGWSLPKDFRPDGGIFYDRSPNLPKGYPGPTGTNLFDINQATAMIRYLVEGMP